MLPMHVYNPLPNSLDIGPLSIAFYALAILTGVIIAVVLGIKEGEKIGISQDIIYDGIIWILPLAILGSRLYYVIFEWERYRGDFLRMIDLRQGGLAIHGAFITAVIAVVFYARWKKFDLLKALDIVAPGFLVAQAMGRWGNFFNQEAHGYVVGNLTGNMPNLSLDEQRAFLSGTLRLPNFIVNNMYFPGPSGLNYYHPTFLYESLWNLTGFALILVLRRTKLIRSGDLIGLYLIWYSIGRFFIEGIRTDSLYFGSSNIRTAQVISLLSIAVGIGVIGLNWFFFKRPKYATVLSENSLTQNLVSQKSKRK
jgi:phosphatidylglycerol:prolipoprotein diacylglycerol transferase